MMDRERWRELEPLLDRALELTATERADWLAQLRAESPELAAQLTLLLSDEARADQAGFLAAPLEVTLAGMRFGAYELEHSLGYGGMGHVWLARRADGQFEGRAAVKLLNLPLLSPAGRARFRREGSVLARLTHPGIARLLDAGVAASGQPYLVLEYVEGQPIDAFADAHALSVPERIRLVQQVLAAVEHAHAKLVVHRDLKPSNLLVTPDGTARLLDFGIAKLLPGESDDAVTALTAVAGSAHTPEYAAPEQLRGEAVTTATDVYAVGVLLYVLLTGRRPFDLAGRSAAEVERIVCGAAPARPSSRFARDVAGDDVADRALARGGTPERLRRQLRGDLDAIVLQALRKEPDRRYATAGALAEDLERYLDGRPVLARPEGARYRARKFVGRHVAGIAMAAAAVLLLAGAALRERTLRQRAETEARTAQAVERFLESVFRVSDPFVRPGTPAGPVTARMLLDRGAARIDSTLAGQPAVSSELRRVFAAIYNDLGANDQAAAMLTRAIAERRTLYGPHSLAVADLVALLGQVRLDQGRFAEAEPLFREALAQRRQLLGEHDTATANSLAELAGLLGRKEQRLEPADSLYHEALAIRRSLLADTAASVAETMNDLAIIVRLEGKYPQAEALYRQALAIQVRKRGWTHPATAAILGNLAQVEEPLGHFDEAERLYRQALAIDHQVVKEPTPLVTIAMANLGGVISRDPRRAGEGEALVRQALEINRRRFGDKHPIVGSGLHDLGIVLAREGRFDEAIADLRQSLDIFRAVFGPEHNVVATGLNDLGSALVQRGDTAAAIPLLRQALAQFRQVRGERHYNTTSAGVNLATALRERGAPADLAEAASLFRSDIAILNTTTAYFQRAQLAAAEIGLGRTLLEQGRAGEAAPVLEQGLALARGLYGPADPHTAEALLGLGSCLLAEGKDELARPLLAQAEAILQPRRQAQPVLAVELDRARARLAPGTRRVTAQLSASSVR